MKVMHRKRLEKLANALEQGRIEHERFYFGGWNVDEDLGQCTQNGCGFAGCAIGQCPSVFPRHWRWRDGLPVMRDDTHADPWMGRHFFGLEHHEFSALFEPREQMKVHGLKYLTEEATPKQVAANIREFLKRKTGDTTNE